MACCCSGCPGSPSRSSSSTERVISTSPACRLGGGPGRIDEQRSGDLTDGRHMLQRLADRRHEADGDARNGGMEKIDGDHLDVREPGSPKLPREPPPVEGGLVRRILEPPSEPFDVPL